MKARVLKLAAIQMVSTNGRVDENLQRADYWTNQVAAAGAELALLPELFSTGFELNANAWQSAEPQGGPTENWLVKTARRHGVHIGGSYLESRAGEYFNTFALAGPDNTILGRVRKRHPCSVEAYVFKGGDDPHVIETALGRIGIAICYDSSLREVWDRLIADDPDLLLMPLSAPSPSKTLFYNQRKIDAFHASFSDGATQSARLLGIPCAISNKWGPWETTLPGIVPRLVLPKMQSSFPGFTHIADSDGREVARVAEGEGFALGIVNLDPARKTLAIPAERDRHKPWITNVPGEYRAFKYFEMMGRRWYAKHRRK